jgi:hypothetical protein
MLSQSIHFLLQNENPGENEGGEHFDFGSLYHVWVEY